MEQFLEPWVISVIIEWDHHRCLDPTEEGRGAATSGGSSLAIAWDHLALGRAE